MEKINDIISKFLPKNKGAMGDSGEFQIIRVPIKTSILLEFLPDMLKRELEVHKESQTQTTQEPSE